MCVEKRFVIPSSKRQRNRLRMTSDMRICVWERVAACNFSNWLVKEPRIEQPDSPYRVNVRNNIDPCIKYLIRRKRFNTRTRMVVFWRQAEQTKANTKGTSEVTCNSIRLLGVHRGMDGLPLFRELGKKLRSSTCRFYRSQFANMNHLRLSCWLSEREANIKKIQRSR